MVTGRILVRWDRESTWGQGEYTWKQGEYMETGRVHGNRKSTSTWGQGEYMGTGRVHGNRESTSTWKQGEYMRTWRVHGNRESTSVCVCGGEGYLNNIEPVGHLLQLDF